MKEFKFVNSSVADVEAKLNEAVADGWEVVSVLPANPSFSAVNVVLCRDAPKKIVPKRVVPKKAAPKKKK
jgi:hypothetical protein